MKLECSKRGASRVGGFTLIEMLVVVVVIIILMGIVFRMTHVAARVSARGQTVARLEALKACIEEYNAEYGTYPPVNGEGNVYEYPGPSLPMAVVRRMVENNKRMFNFGLASYFVKRYSILGDETKDVDEVFQNEQWTGYNSTRGDLERDCAFVDRIAPFLNKVGLPHGGHVVYTNDVVVPYTNQTLSLPDGFGNQFVYVTRPPYASYTLFSPGPDRRYNAEDPLNPDADGNKDNIYGNVGE